MSGVNKVILIGNLGKDPDVRHLNNGSTVCNFSIATTESYKDRDSGKRVDQTEWHNIVLWHGLAEVAEQYLKKGDSIYIEGKLRTRSWEKDGITRYTTEVVGKHMTMLGNKKDNQDNPVDSSTREANREQYAQQRAKEQQDSQATPPPPSEEDDLPF